MIRFDPMSRDNHSGQSPALRNARTRNKTQTHGQDEIITRIFDRQADLITLIAFKDADSPVNAFDYQDIALFPFPC